MTREEKQKAIDALKISAPIMAVTQEKFTDYIQTLNKIMDWLEQVPCEDAISRQAAINVASGFCHHANVADELAKLPSVNPQEPKTGHWIKDDITERSKSAYKHKCDRCGAYHRAMYDYCPSCGAKMAESEG